MNLHRNNIKSKIRFCELVLSPMGTKAWYTCCKSFLSSTSGEACHCNSKTEVITE